MPGGDYWNDARLVWNPDPGGIGFVTFRGGNNEIWGPDNIVYEPMETWDIIPDIDFQVYMTARSSSRPMVRKVPMDVRVPARHPAPPLLDGQRWYHRYMVHASRAARRQPARYAVDTTSRTPSSRSSGW